MLAAHAVSKAALNMLTLQYARALADSHITVNTVAPGACRTDLTASLGLAPQRTADEGAAIAVRLATMADSPTDCFLHADGTRPPGNCGSDVPAGR